VDVDEGAVEEAVVVTLEDAVEDTELEIAEPKATVLKNTQLGVAGGMVSAEGVRDAEDVLDAVLDGSTPDTLDASSVYAESRQLAPHMTAESPAQGMSQLESGARLLSAREFQQ
jgi:hypothetical protein